MNDHLPGFQMQAISCYFINYINVTNKLKLYVYTYFYVLNDHKMLLTVLNYYYKCIKYCHYEYVKPS